MVKKGLFLIVFLAGSSVLFGGSLQEVYNALPADTAGFIATAGSGTYGEAFDQSSVGQIYNDPQVQTFLQQIITAVSSSQMPEFSLEDADKPLAFAKTLLTYPTAVGFSFSSGAETDAPPLVFLISKAAAGREAIDAMIAESLLEPKHVARRDIQGHAMYVSADPNCPAAFYFGWVGDTFAAAFNDTSYAFLTQLSSGTSSFSVPSVLSSPAAGSDAFAGYMDLHRLIGLMSQEGADEAEVQQILNVLEQLGLADMRSYAVCGGFEGKNIVIRGKLEVPTDKGLWRAFQPVDRGALSQIDAGVMQAEACYVDPVVIYDTVLAAIDQVPCDPNQSPRDIIKRFEADPLGFAIRDDLLACLEGTLAGYSVPAYFSPELPMGGCVVKVKLKDVEKFAVSMDKLGQVLASVSEGQMQVSSQTTASGKEVHIWAVSFMAMMQFIPAWAIQGDVAVIASHPALVGRVLEQDASGTAATSILSDPEFSGLVQGVPLDAFSIGLSNSKLTARQAMLSLQQFWPMIRMGVMEQGMNLPIMLPPVDKYIAEMEPGISYESKTPTGLEWYYKGCGIESSNGAMAGAAMGAAIIMPALSKTKKVAQRTVSATNLKGIGLACVVYANDYDGKFPESLEVLVAECDVSPKTLESPRKPAGFDGPDYILIQGLTDDASAAMVLVYENPGFCNDGEINVLYADGHVAAVGKDELLSDLRKTYEYLGKPMPEIQFPLARPSSQSIE